MEIQPGVPLPSHPVYVRLVGGPSDGEYARVPAYHARCWQRVPGTSGVKSYFALYTKNFTTRGEFVFAAEEPIIGVVQLAERMAAQQERNRQIKVMGSYGA